MTVRTEDFERHRSLLFSIAYRMLGSVAEAEDVVQEAYLRWREVAEARRLTVPDLRCPEGGEVPRRGASHGAARFLRPFCADQWRTRCSRLRGRPPYRSGGAGRSGGPHPWGQHSCQPRQAAGDTTTVLTGSVRK